MVDGEEISSVLSCTVGQFLADDDEKRPLNDGRAHHFFVCRDFVIGSASGSALYSIVDIRAYLFNDGTVDIDLTAKLIGFRNSADFTTTEFRVSGRDRFSKVLFASFLEKPRLLCEMKDFKWTTRFDRKYFHITTEVVVEALPSRFQRC